MNIIEQTYLNLINEENAAAKVESDLSTEFEKIKEELDRRLSDKDICKWHGYANGWGTDIRSRAIWSYVESRHNKMKKEHPEQHKEVRYLNRGDNQESCSCGFSFSWDSSD